MNIATQIAADFFSSMDEFDSVIEANEHFFYLAQLKSTSYECDGLKTTYGFRDNSSISFKKNAFYLLDGEKERYTYEILSTKKDKNALNEEKQKLLKRLSEIELELNGEWA